MGHLLLFPGRASSIAPHVDAVMFFVLAIAIFFSALIAILIVGFSIKYHYRRQADRSNAPTFNLAIELVWTGVPLVLVLVMFGWGARVYINEHQPPPGALEIYVLGKQWMWKVQHPEGAREINSLHIPVGRPVKLIMTSQDVIHSFYVPDFRVKQDVLPGRYSSEWFEATAPGRYHLFCAEFCGTLHSGMVGWVTAMKPTEYARWLANPEAQPGLSSGQAGVSMVASGERLFTRLACVTCHRADGHGTGPALNGLIGSRVRLANGRALTADEAYIRESIVHPMRDVVRGYQPTMPTFEGQVGEEELMQLVAYIKSLSGARTSEE
jgi:cytochrome c oxidase subunit 2